MRIQQGCLAALMVSIAGAAPAMAQCENVTLTTQAAVDNFDCTTVTGFLVVQGFGAGAITNLDGLSGLTSVGGFLRIINNPSLTDVDALSRLTSVGGFLQIFDNPSLTEFCGLFPLLNANGLVGTYIVLNNGANPTRTQILAAGPCDPAEVVVNLMDDVIALEDGGVLNRGQTNALLAKLGRVFDAIDEGKLNVACNVLTAFINHVTDLIAEGVLTAAEGDPLLESASNARDGLGCRSLP